MAIGRCFLRGRKLLNYFYLGAKFHYDTLWILFIGISIKKCVKYGFGNNGKLIYYYRKDYHFILSFTYEISNDFST